MHMVENLFNLVTIGRLLEQYGLNHYSVIIKPELESTNNYALENIEQLSDNSVIVCEKQTSGQGRGGKVWKSQAYIDVTASLIHKFPLDFNYELLPLVISVAVNRLFKQLRVATKVKWPNDIWLLDKTKVVGILLAAKTVGDERYIVTGIGLNNIQNWERNGLLVDLIKQVNDVLMEYKVFGFALFRQEWLDNCIHHRKIISLYQHGQLLARGMHMDLTNNGKIILKDQNSSVISEYFGATISLTIEDLVS